MRNNDRASEVLLSKEKSLLAAGITKINDAFQRGDTIDIANTGTRKDFARGLTNYNSLNIEKIKLIIL